MAKYMRPLAAVGLLLGITAGSLAASGSAVASTPGCTNKYPACGVSVNMYSNAWDVLGQRAAVNAPIIVWPDRPTDPATDFIRTAVLPGIFRYQYAPRGVPSGLCVSNPDGGYAQDPGGPGGLILRRCNGSVYQQFQNNIGNIHGNELMSMADLLIVIPNGTGAQLSMSLQDMATQKPGSYWAWKGQQLGPNN